MRKYIGAAAVIFFLAGSLSLAGCSSGPSEQELSELERLRASVKSLREQVETKKSEKARLEQQIAAKQAQLDAELKEQAATKQRMESQK
jgi:outer membrane murein-binding lipoprotein Lpp